MPLLFARPDDVRQAAADLEIALVNNLSDAGLVAGERQFGNLVAEAAGPRRVRLHLVSLPSISRAGAARARVATRYTPLRQLLDHRLDGLIVTGCEPHADDLADEPFWPELTELIEWAACNTRAAIWSCLAAHAAVLHLDGVRRRRLAEKCSGLFRVEARAGHALSTGFPPNLRVPHSRWNTLAAEDVAAAGYQVLTRGTAVGVDTFSKVAPRTGGSLFVFLQGHPEYEPATLAREYRRDVGRYLSGASDIYPGLPTGCFDAASEAALIAFAGEVRRRRDPHLAQALPTAVLRAPGTRNLGRTLMRNWLDQIFVRTSDHAA